MLSAFVQCTYKFQLMTKLEYALLRLATAPQLAFVANDALDAYLISFKTG